MFETLQTCFISEALSEGWAVAFPQADISWMVAAANDITDIPVHDSDFTFCTNHLLLIQKNKGVLNLKKFSLINAIHSLNQCIFFIN